MKLKFIGIFVLALLLILGLLQIEAIGNLNPIFHSIAVSVRQMVDWVLAAYSPNTIILRGEPELLNVDTVQEYFPNHVKKSTLSQHNKESDAIGPAGRCEGFNVGFLKGRSSAICRKLLRPRKQHRDDCNFCRKSPSQKTL